MPNTPQLRGLHVLMAGAAVVVLATAQTKPQLAPLIVDYPSSGSIFPPEITPPTFLWRDPAQDSTLWLIDVAFADGSPAIHVKSQGERMSIGEIDPRVVAPTNEPPKLTPQQAAARTWTPDAGTWAAIRERSKGRAATVTIMGIRGAQTDRRFPAARSLSRYPGIRWAHPFSTGTCRSCRPKWRKVSLSPWRPPPFR